MASIPFMTGILMSMITTSGTALPGHVYGLLAILRLPHDLDVCHKCKKAGEPLAHDRMIVYKQNANSTVALPDHSPITFSLQIHLYLIGLHSLSGNDKFAAVVQDHNTRKRKGSLFQVREFYEFIGKTLLRRFQNRNSTIKAFTQVSPINNSITGK